LFTGDAEVETEAEFITRDAEALAATIYQVGHHGSYTSSSPALVAAIRPEVAVYSAGKPTPTGTSTVRPSSDRRVGVKAGPPGPSRRDRSDASGLDADLEPAATTPTAALRPVSYMPFGVTLLLGTPTSMPEDPAFSHHGSAAAAPVVTESCTPG
jgi:hypothetical protein